MRRPSLPLLLLLLAACGGDSGPTEPPPPPPFVMQFAGTTSVTGRRGVDAQGRANVSCDYTIVASASGGGQGAVATWMGAGLEWRLHQTGETFNDEISNLQMADWFGSDRISTGLTQTARRNANWRGPFTLSHTFRFRLANGELRTSLFQVQCL